MRTQLALCLLAAGCVSGHGSGDGGNGKAPPFTNGVSTLAGAAEAGYVDGNRDIARFHNPVGVAYGPDGKVYVADFDNSKIRVVQDDGTTSTVIAQQGFCRPFGLAFAGSTLYATTDSNNMCGHTPMKTGSVWKIDIGARQATEIADSIGMPRGIAVLQNGKLALSDYENHVVELLDPATGAVTPLAGARGTPGMADGTGAAALFNTPYALVQRSDGKLVVIDAMNNRIRLVGLDGSVSTMAGTGKAGFNDGAMAGAMFDLPEGLAMASNGDIFVTDLGNFRVRKISGSTITTVAGDGMGGYVDDDDLMSAEFYGLEGISVRPDGSMAYVADGTRGDDVPYNRVRQIKLK